MYTKDDLEKLPSEELEKIHEELKSELETKIGKNRRIQKMLERKINKIQAEVDLLEKKHAEILSSHPELNVVKSVFDEQGESLNDLKARVNDFKNTLRALESSKIQVEKSINEYENKIALLKEEYDKLQSELRSIVKDTESLEGSVGGHSELDELALLTQEFNKISQDFQDLNNEIEKLTKLIHKT